MQTSCAILWRALIGVISDEKIIHFLSQLTKNGTRNLVHDSALLHVLSPFSQLVCLSIHSFMHSLIKSSMTTVETRVANPLPNRTSVNTVDVADTEMVDSAMKHSEEEREEKIIVDEEIDSSSCEGNDLEEQMLTVALVKSVVETGNQNLPNNDNQHARYGLRKRRRPGDSPSSEPTQESDPKRASTGSPVKADPDLTAVNVEASTNVVDANVKAEENPAQLREPPDIKTFPTVAVKQEQIPGPAIVTSLQSSIIDNPTGTAKPLSPAPPATGVVPVPAATGPTMQPAQPARQPVANPVPARPQPVVPVKIESKPAIARPAVAATQPKKASPQKHSMAAPQPVNPAPATSRSLSAAALVPISGAVPNPLSQSTPPVLRHPYQAANGVAQGKQTASSVPCPLPPASVPCPLQPEIAQAPLEKKVTISEPPVPTSRGRIFSVDLDRKCCVQWNAWSPVV